MKNISSFANKTIKDAISLKDSRERKKTGLFLVDGIREVGLAITAGLEANTIFICGEIIKKNNKEQKLLLDKIINLPQVIDMPIPVFKKISYKENVDGVIGVFKQNNKLLRDIKSTSNLTLIIEGVEKPGNLGAIIRTAEAFGVGGIIVNDNVIDIFNPNVIRASEGLSFFLPIVKASCEETLVWLKKNGITSFAAATQAKERASIADMTGRCAIILGSEAKGLSDFWLSNVDKAVRIPMKSGVDSLNLSVSAAILIYEACRQQGFIKLC